MRHMAIETNQIITGDCLDVLDDLSADSVHCVMTSPPYWNLRDYDHADQLGREETAEGFVQNIADVMDKVGRVLREDGSLWLNLGDTYDNKDCQMIPQRVALEMRNRGWILRNKVVWAKENPMPHSVKDRLNDTTERIYHFVRCNEYFYDLDAIREPYDDTTTNRYEYAPPKGEAHEDYADATPVSGGDGTVSLHESGKNPGDVFTLSTQAFPDAHFAVYPPELCEKPIKATCPPDGIVLDPFAGAGTTCLKAKELDRRFIGIELNPEYADMARARVGLSPHNPANVRDNDDQQGLEQY